ncbi:MAG: hypothetical protein IK099_07980 [Clostridia bacterium]|nr:hypothetical protein [Clostridia bacterium]
MTEKQFWMKLDQLSMKPMEDAASAAKMALIIRSACEQGLHLIVACTVEDGETKPLCIAKNEDERLIICYTSKEMAKSDKIEGSRELLLVEGVINMMRERPAVGGLIFNPQNEKRMMAIPKLFFAQDTDEFAAQMERIMKG